MLTVTEAAKQLLKRLLLARTEDPDLSLRLEGEPGQFRIKLDSEVPGDQVLEYKGAKVLLVEPALALLLEEANLDVLDTPDGPKLVVLGIKWGLKALDILSYEDREVSMMGKKGSKKTVRKAHRESAAYLRKGPKKSKGSKGSK